MINKFINFFKKVLVLSLNVMMTLIGLMYWIVRSFSYSLIYLIGFCLAVKIFLLYEDWDLNDAILMVKEDLWL
ncbi:hypothetical protein ASU4_02980 [Actinobacillus suis]|nr:hypothetical protein ASU5_04455 [Actinobacillus suis]OQS60984.1 hypothetical protein ASU4_02980 [Actinobacillus suis]